MSVLTDLLLPIYCIPLKRALLNNDPLKKELLNCNRCLRCCVVSAGRLLRSQLGHKVQLIDVCGTRLTALKHSETKALNAFVYGVQLHVS